MDGRSEAGAGAASAGWLDQDRLTRRCRALPRSRSCSDCISKRWRLSVKNGGEAKDLMLDFEAACDAHIRWRVRFRSAINAQETLDARRISEDHHCEVGIWLQGAGHRRFADHPVSLLAWRNMLHFTSIGRASCRERVWKYV